MKKFILLLLSFTIFCFSPTVAKAETPNYSRIMSERVTLYMDSNLTMPWFTLPVGYYLKVLSVNGSSVKVEYKCDQPTKPSVKGYIPLDDFNAVDGIPQTLFPTLTLTVNQNCLLYKDVDFSITETISQNSTIDYYGIIENENGEKFIYGYVSTTFGDKYVGYMSINAVYDFIIPSLKIEEKTESVEISSEDKQSDTATTSLGENLQIVIIIAVSLVAISIVYLLFRPTPTKARDEVITASEFEDE